jgi:hypothetical protein
MKNCRNLHPLLPLFRDHALSPAQEKRVQIHLKTCAQARREMKEFDHLAQALAALPEPQLPGDLHDRIIAHLNPERVSQPVAKFRWRLPTLGLMAAACLTLFFLVQYPDVMNPGGKKVYEPFGQTLKTTVPPNQPPAVSQKPFHADSLFMSKTAQPPAQNFAPVENTDANLKPMPLADEEEKIVTRAAVPRHKAAKRAKIESGGQSDQSKDPSSSSGPSNPASTTLALAPSTSNNNYTTMASSNGGLLSMKQEQPLPSTAASVPMAAAPEANAVAALPPVAANGNIVSTPFTPAPVLYQSWSGAAETASAEEQNLVTDAETFKAYWETFQPGKEMPVVDFTKQAVVVLLDSQRPTGGYHIHVSGLEEITDHLIVHYKTDNPPDGTFTIQVLTWPWSLQIISKPETSVVFQRDP